MCQHTAADLALFEQGLLGVPGSAAPVSTGPALSRRGLLAGALAVSAAAALPGGPLVPATAQAATRTPTIRARSAWAGTTCPIRGRLPVEAAGNTRFLEVHHSVLPSNTYSQAQVPAILRLFYKMHVDKGWPDIAYNFLIDRFGTIWEGRAGSRTSPVITSATGGNQGLSQKVCFIGDHRKVAPTALMNDRMVSALAMLATKYRIPTAPGKTATFISRGSNLLPAGMRCTVPTIVGHRQVVRTACPGDAAFRLVKYSYPTWVTRCT